MMQKVNRVAREQLEGALIESEVRYRQLFELAQDGIILVDSDTGEICDVNPFLVKMLGFSRKNS